MALDGGFPFRGHPPGFGNLRWIQVRRKDSSLLEPAGTTATPEDSLQEHRDSRDRAGLSQINPALPSAAKDRGLLVGGLSPATRPYPLPSTLAADMDAAVTCDKLGAWRLTAEGGPNSGTTNHGSRTPDFVMPASVRFSCTRASAKGSMALSAVERM